MLWLAKLGLRTWMTERGVHTPSLCHPCVCPHPTSRTPCLFHPCCVWCPFNQPYPSSGWMGTTHINMDYREKGWLNGGRTHTCQKEWYVTSLCHPWVYDIRQPYPFSLQSMLCLCCPFNQQNLLSCWMKDTHTTWVTDRRVQLANWGQHACMAKRRVCTLPFVIHMFEPPFTSHTPCLFHPCCVWRPFNQPYPSPLVEWGSHTYKAWMRETGTAGWMGLHMSMAEKWVHTPSLCHPCCVWNPFNQLYPSFGLNDGHNTHNIYGREKGSFGLMRVARVYDRDHGMYPTLCHPCVCVPIYQSYPLSRPAVPLLWLNGGHRLKTWMPEWRARLADWGSHKCMTER